MNRRWVSVSDRVTPHAPMTLGANHVSRGQKGGTLPLLVISGLATGPPAGMGDGSGRFWARELRVSQHFSTFYGSSVQAMDA